MFKSIWKLTSALALIALVTAPAEAVPPGGPLMVNCNIGDSISEAADGAKAGKSLTIEVKGTCTEEVVITTDDITIQPHVSGGKVIGGFTINGAQRVTIKDLTIKDGTTGMNVTRGAAVVLEGLVLSGHPENGIWLNRNAYADIIEVLVEQPPVALKQ